MAGVWPAEAEVHRFMKLAILPVSAGLISPSLKLIHSLPVAV